MHTHILQVFSVNKICSKVDSRSAEGPSGGVTYNIHMPLHCYTRGSGVSVRGSRKTHFHTTAHHAPYKDLDEDEVNGWQIDVVNLPPVLHLLWLR